MRRRTCAGSRARRGARIGCRASRSGSTWRARARRRATGGERPSVATGRTATGAGVAGDTRADGAGGLVLGQCVWSFRRARQRVGVGRGLPQRQLRGGAGGREGPGCRETAPAAGYAEARGRAAPLRATCVRRTGGRATPTRARSWARHPSVCGWRAQWAPRRGTPSRCFAPRGRLSRALRGSSTARAGRGRCASGAPTTAGTGAARSPCGWTRGPRGTSTPRTWRGATRRRG